MRNLFFLILIAICLAAPALTARPSNWNKFTRAKHTENVSFRVALKQRNLDVLESTLLDVSNPESVNYGKHWTMEQIIELVAPVQSVQDSVVEYLTSNGCVNIENKGDFIKADAPVSAIEKLFSVKMFNYKHAIKAQTIIRSDRAITVPSLIAQHVDIVSGISELPHLSTGPKSHNNARPQFSGVKGTQPPAPASDPGLVVPQTVQRLYNIPANFVPAGTNVSFGVAEFQADRSYNPQDLVTFAAKTATPLIVVAHDVGTFEPTNPDLEATLDVQYGAIIAEGADNWFFVVSGWMYEFASELATTFPAPYVVSMSWGWPEPSQCSVGTCTGGESSLDYVNRVNVEFQKIGLRGITLLASSGDQGAPGDSNSSCDDEDAPISTIFPGASPWVTSVGATMLTAPTDSSSSGENSDIPVCGIHPCATSMQETTCSTPTALITTGGGFSDYVPVPSWQAASTKKYLSSGVLLPNKKFFNATNRGFPDVSALGHNFYIVAADQKQVVDGTSASSPIFGGIISLLNGYRLSNGKSTLGFVNPVLYAAAASSFNAFTDITSGNNFCAEQCCATTGYIATKGWDPVTGLGTPNFPGLSKYISTLN